MRALPTKHSPGQSLNSKLTHRELIPYCASLMLLWTPCQAGQKMATHYKFTDYTSVAIVFGPFDFGRSTIVCDHCFIICVAADDDKCQHSSGGHVPTINRQQTPGSQDHSHGGIVSLLSRSRPCDPTTHQMAVAEAVRAR